MNVTRLVACVAILIVPVATLTFSPDVQGKTKKAKTVDELAAMYDSRSCKQCHEKIYTEWEESLHARSFFGTGRTGATIKTTVVNGLMKWPASGVKKPKDVKVKHLMTCAKCHLPQLEDATDAVAQELVTAAFTYTNPKASDDAIEEAVEKLEKVNINCLICHNRNAVIHKWADGFPKKKEVYGSKNASHPSSSHPVLKKSKVMSESILCGQCHGHGPNFELENPSQCATLYGSYLWAYRAEGGQETCQECHMKKSKLGHNMQSYRDAGLAKAAVDFRAEMMGYQWRDGSIMVPEALVKVEMVNRAGHAIPDG